MRVLVVDDEEPVLTLLRRYLHKWGHEVTTATNGEAAWKLFDDAPFPMVITDWMMPALSGLELIRRIRSHALGARVYSLLLTGRAAREDVVLGMDAGADDFLAKPFDKDELRVRVREGERIVELERARTRAETLCAHMQELITRCSKTAAHDLDEAVELLVSMKADTKAAREEAISHLSSAREIVTLLRSDADQRNSSV